MELKILVTKINYCFDDFTFFLRAFCREVNGEEFIFR